MDDNPDRHRQFDIQYSGCDVVNCYTVDQFVDCLKNDAFDHFDMISLDHDLNDFDSHSTNYDGQEATGMDACGLMVNKKFASKLPDVINIQYSFCQSMWREQYAIVSTESWIHSSLDSVF